MNSICTHWRHWRLAALTATLTLVVACEEAAPPAATPATADFKSVKPGGAGKNGKSMSQGEASSAVPTSAGADKSGQSAAPKIEQGDVARLQGTTLYILNQWRGLQIVDVKQPAAPKLTGKVAMTGSPREMYIDGSEAVVLLSQVAELKDDAGKPSATSGSQIRRVQLGAAAKETASVAISGYIAASKRIGDKLIVVAPQVSWNPWYVGCFGPYGCASMAEGGVSTSDVAVSTKGGASAGGASIAYPGGMGGGWQATKTKVYVIDLATAGKLSIAGQVEFDGGVLTTAIDIGEVLVASQNYIYANTGGTMEERLTQIAVDTAGKPTLAAVQLSKTVLGTTNSAQLVQADRVGSGRMALVRQNWKDGGGYTYTVESWQAAAGAWTKTASITKAGGNSGLRVVVAGTQAVVASSTAVDGTSGGGTDQPSPGKDPDDGNPPVQKIGLDVLDLATAATIATVGHLDLANGGYDIWGMQLRALQDGFWLVGHRGVSYSDMQLEILDLLEPKAPKLVSKVTIKSEYGLQAELLAPDLLAVAVVGSAGGKSTTGSGTGAEPAGQLEAGVQLLSLSKAGALTKRGLFKSEMVYWYQLKNLLDSKLLYRINNAALEVVDVGDLDKPKKLASLELATEVADAIVAGDRVVALVQNWAAGKAELRVLAPGSNDELNPAGKLEILNGYGRMYANGNFVYLADGSAVRVFDISDPKAPKARGTWQQPVSAFQSEDNTWWNTYELAQNGAVLYATSTQVKYKVITGKACEQQGVGSTGASTGSAPSSGGAEPAPASDGGSSSGGSSGSSGSADAGSSSGTPGTDSADGGGSPDDPKQGTDAPYVPTCYIDPVFTTKVVAIDLSNPDAPKIGGSVELKGASWVQNPQVVGKTLVLSHYKSVAGKDGQWWGEYYLDRIDVTTATTPKIVDSTNVPGWLVGVAQDGKSAVTLDWQTQKGSKVEDNKIENVLVAITLGGGKAKIAKSLPLPEQVGATLRFGDAIYVSTWPYWWNWPTAGKAGEPMVAPESKLLVFDAKDPAKLTQVAALNAGAGVSSLHAEGGILFAGVGPGLGLTAWSLATPTQPKFAAFVPTPGYWSPRVLMQGKTAYLPSGWYGVQSFELTP
ncbi:MAG: hypothetical protein EXR77_04185 [Myxococcales bacterium]|nr:hypothetical protein [Myxococcales bacterium]